MRVSNVLTHNGANSCYTPSVSTVLDITLPATRIELEACSSKLERRFTHHLPTTFDGNFELLVRGFHDLSCRLYDSDQR